MVSVIVCCAVLNSRRLESYQRKELVTKAPILKRPSFPSLLACEYSRLSIRRLIFCQFKQIFVLRAPDKSLSNG